MGEEVLSESMTALSNFKTVKIDFLLKTLVQSLIHVLASLVPLLKQFYLCLIE